ncbi:4-hydroxybenzoate 3-monooxygenase [Streptomyces gamaensis]|uniref:4-hydroxybenzoate 3-monooxygenase n=1 Tax=Streptomyces gamaensis TaxID=1763542 RepID=A0ABW0Z9B5_9ACTN
MRTTVGIIGAGPAGLLLARLLHRAGVDCVVLEARDRERVERGRRGGLLEQGVTDALRECGAADRLDRDGLELRGVELRFEGRSHRVDLPSLTGGRTVVSYPQSELVKDLVLLQLLDGPPLLFGARALAVEKPDSEQPLIRFVHEGREQTLECEWVAGCDGARGVSQDALPADGVRAHGRTHPCSWLGILAEAPPFSDELLLAGHERGFALHTAHTPRLSRFCLQVPDGTRLEEWPEERVWEELEVRLAAGGGELRRGPVVARSVTALRSRVTEPMRHGRLLLAGDAAHLVLPTAAKGLNLALADAVTMARGFFHWRVNGSAQLLDRYSELCLRRVWQAQRFAHDLTALLHAPPDGDPYDRQLQLAWLRRLTGPTAAAAELAENCAGPPLF